MTDFLLNQDWMYLDDTGAPKGPIPVTILTRLLEKNLGITGTTLAWKAGMEKWVLLAEVRVNFQFRSD